MHFQHLTPLLPCRALDELSSNRRADEAEQLLSAWSALWHPALVSAARAMPRWSPAESPPQEPSGYLFILPPCCEGLLPAGWLEEVEKAGGCVLRNLHHRPDMVATALARIETDAAETAWKVLPAEINAELAADFLALGFCHFAIELLTQHLRYMSNLDEASFERELVAGAEYACQGDVEGARGRLQAAFDLLHTAREYFYPVEAHLLDLTLLASTTLGQSLRGALAAVDQSEPPSRGGKPINFLVSGAVVEEMAQREPTSLAALRIALEGGRAAVLGGEFRELELPLLPPEAIRYQLRKGLDSYQRHLGMQPSVFGRRRFGMTPVLPQILEKMGFVGTLHATLDDGRFPTNNQSRARWEGIDGTVIEALTRVPSDIGRADAFLRLPQQLGNSMDMDHVATVLFAHWPGRSSMWYDDVRRITRYTTVMGSFSTVTDYFKRTGMSGQQAAYKADEYHSPYLKQEVAACRDDPISRWVRYYRDRATVEAIQALDALTALAGRFAGPVSAEDLVTPANAILSAGEETGGGLSQSPLDENGTVPFPRATVIGSPVLSAVEDSLANGPVDENQLAPLLTKGLEESVKRFSDSVGTGVQPNGQGFLVANPSSFSRRVCLEAPELRTLPDAAGPVQWAADSAGRKTVVVDVPPMGFAWFGPGAGETQPVKPTPRTWGILRSRPAEAPPLAERLIENPGRGRPARRRASEDPAGETPAIQGAVLRNEFLELIIDPHTAAIRAISDYKSRGPRLGQQIAMRLPEASGQGDNAYSIMAADEITITSPGPLLGETVARGRLLDRSGRRLAGFQQTTRVWRGSRVIEVEIELDLEQLPGPDPWNSYYAARFAWADEASNLYRSVNMANLPTETTQLEAPHFIDVRLDKLRTTLLSGGLPYHRRIGLRRLDTLLVVRGERARRFRLGIGIDLTHPMHAALDFLAPRTMQADAAPPPNPSGWLFHLDARNVVATHWEPLYPSATAVPAVPVGFRVRLLETDGRPVSLRVRSFRDVQSAQKVGTVDRPAVELPIEGDRLRVELGGYEWAEVEARFA
jgi:alpha-mannosidase